MVGVNRGIHFRCCASKEPLVVSSWGFVHRGSKSLSLFSFRDIVVAAVRCVFFKKSGGKSLKTIFLLSRLVRFLIVIANCVGYSGGLIKSDNLQVKGNASLSSE